MTREEAVGVIERLPVMSYMKKNEKQTIITTALNIAIEALQEPERKRGRWIEKSKWQSGRWIKWYECSICGEKDYNVEVYEDMPFIGLSNFCPQCGADMRGE